MADIRRIHQDSKVIQIDTKQIFGFDITFNVFAFAQKSDFVPNIDPNFMFNIKVTKSILAALMFNKPSLVLGLHGSGKTSHIEQVAARLNWPVIRINLDGHIVRSDIVGRDIIKIQDSKQVTDFQEGLLVRSLKSNYILILDEYDAAPSDVMFVLQNLLEKNGKLTLLESGEVIIPDKYFRIFATANSIGQGRELGLYHGVHQINQGQLDRWEQIINIDYLNKSEEKKLLIGKFSNLDDKLENLIDDIVELTSLIRNAFINGQINNVITVRGSINLIENYLIYQSMKDAFKISFYNILSKDDRIIIGELYQRIFAEEL